MKLTQKVFSSIKLKVGYLFFVSLSYFFTLTQTVLAQAPTPTVTTFKLNNPLKIDSIEGLLEAILTVIVVLATPIVVFFIIYSGFLYVTARGNPEQVQQASRALTYAVIGGVLIIGSVAIARIIGNLVAAF